jgi:tetratricopeptide (TPR) repeat protein
MLLIASLGWFASWSSVAFAQTNDDISIVELRGTVEILPHGAANWLQLNLADTLHPHDRVRTGTNSSVSLVWSGQTPLRFSDLTEMEILPPEKPGDDHSLRLIQGLLYFFHRDKPGRIRIITSGAFAGVEGTEFTMQVATTNGVEQTTLSVIDGKVRLSNNAGTLLLTNGDQAVAEPGQAPRRTPGFIANNLLQWCFYYPGVLDWNDLPPAMRNDNMLGESLTAYRDGDLLAALAKYPDTRPDDSDAERLYHAALLLSVGKVAETETILATIAAINSSETSQRLANALRTLIAAVKREPRPSNDNYELPTELLAGSYYEQSLAGPNSLATALQLARRAVTNSPNFGFGWERVAELEFSFGRTERALVALNKALMLSPRNAQALSLNGFLLAAQNQPRAALEQFDRALAVDSALGNAWLGRGLCRIRVGEAKAGREDLLIAAAMEPQRAALRSYLGKAFGDAGDTHRATHELQLAKQLDPNDPTAWLYSALLDEQNNQINDAIRDLEKSQELNDNRSVYRSGLLLDQDEAVRSANLARIYQEAGLDDVSVREASRAVDSDYANYSAHLFLANSYEALEDPNHINLRYETPAESEYLLANLLAPVGAGTLSSEISQQEYSKLLQQDGVGAVSDTEYLSRGAWTESGSQYGIFGNFSYNLDASYHTDPGQRPNDDYEERNFSLQMKDQLTSRDMVYFQGTLYDANGGDLAEYYNQAEANLGLRTKETQYPILILGYRHEWAPGIQTLLLAGRLTDRYQVENPSQTSLFVYQPSGGPAAFVEPVSVNEIYNSDLTIYSGELQQIFELSRQTLVFGGRFQSGDFKTSTLQYDPQNSDVSLFFPNGNVAAIQNFDASFQRVSGYAYDTLRIADPLSLTVGVSYDSITFPQNFRAAPISGQEQDGHQLSPKAGLIWTPIKDFVVRAAYTRSLSGASIDQSFQIEPSEVAGFNQSFRSLIPESVGGANVGAAFETYDVSLEKKFPTGTYIALSGELLKSKVNRTLGTFDLYDINNGFTVPSGTPEKLAYQEPSLLFTFNQLVGQTWSFGVRYQLSHAELNDSYPAIPESTPVEGSFQPQQDLQATLQELRLEAFYNHPSGFFGQLEGIWNYQKNQGYLPAIGGSDFWQFNAYVGYRFFQRRAQLQLGLLNLTGQNYQLNPLNLYNELPRQMTFVARLQIGF